MLLYFGLLLSAYFGISLAQDFEIDPSFSTTTTSFETPTDSTDILHRDRNKGEANQKHKYFIKNYYIWKQ